MGNTDLIENLRARRFDLSTEKATQGDLKFELFDFGISFDREVRLNQKDIIDFIVEGGVGIEIKLSGRPVDIYRQLERYAQHAQIKSLILLTNKAMNLPDTINNKPVTVINMGRAWL